jgi:peptide chain release factor 1
MNLPSADELRTEIDNFVTQMSDPAISRDPNKMKELTAQHKIKEELLRYITQIDKIKTEITEAESMINDEDDEMKALAEDDLVRLNKRENTLNKAIETLLIERDPRDERDVIIEIRAGAGGDEAGLFAAEIMRSYTRYAEDHGWKMHIVSTSTNEQGGYKEVVAECSGTKVFGVLKFERGVHRVQRIPETEKQGRIHTSTVTVAILAQAKEVDIEIKSEDLRIDTYRASGAGGQHVNKTDSAVRITHLPTNTVVAVQDERSQHKNKAKAMSILRARVLESEEEKRTSAEASDRRQQVGSGNRSEKIRTYNYPQDRITDHRIKKSWSNIESVMSGQWDPIFHDMREADNEMRSK